jgi:hypothetical protein
MRVRVYMLEARVGRTLRRCVYVLFRQCIVCVC